MATEKDSGPEQKKVIRLYAAFGAALVLSLIPLLPAAILTLVLFIGVLIAAYAMRRKSPEGSLTENHATFIIRTLWITGLLTLATLVAASFYLLGVVDNATLEPCLGSFLALGEQVQTMGISALSAVFQPCLDLYIKANMRAFLTAGAIAAGPVLLYIILRFTRGLARAARGYRIANPQSWL